MIGDGDERDPRTTVDASTNGRETPETAPAGPSSTRDSTLQPGDTLDRYMLIEEQGHGGMGVVYRAFDPDLERQVALKLLRVRRTSPSRARLRLLREAQALAQLSHPNVVAVYDVGTVDHDVYLAMEYVEGPTLSQWLRAEQRSQRDILAAFMDAGRGLAAAHDAGLVHRDFKPSNVLVGNDGRVRVLDFGLARATAPSAEADTAGGTEALSPSALASSAADQAPADDAGHPSLLSTPVTVHGFAMGTPAYMSPEQHRGDAIDAASDQFSYCVALYQALCGVHPFGDSDEQRRERVMQAPIEPPERHPGAPGWVHDVIARGLHADPSARYPSMRALLDDLSADPPARRRRRVAIAGVLLATTAATWFASRAASPHGVSCEPPADALRGAWDDDVARSMRAAFAHSKVPYAATTLPLVERQIRDYAATWRTMYRTSCSDTHRRRRFSTDVLDLRMLCLDRRKTALAALTTHLSRKLDAKAVEHAVRGAQTLPAIDECADVATLRRAAPLPEDKRARDDVRAIERQLAEVTALHALGSYPAALQLANKVLARANRTGYAPLRSKALYLTANLARLTGDDKRAEVLLTRTLQAAAEADNRQDAAAAWIDLLLAVGGSRQRFTEIPWLIRAADQAVHWPDIPDSTRAQYYGVLGSVRQHQGKYDEAQKLFESSLALLQAHQSPDLPRALDSLGVLLIERGKLAEAKPLVERALSLTEAALGPDHPRNAYYANNVGRVLEGLGDLRGAIANYKHAIELWEAVLGPNDDHIAHPLTNLGNVYFRMRRLHEAERAHTRALAIFRKRYGDDHPLVGIALVNRAEALRALGRLDTARKLLERALALFKTRLGPKHPYTLYAQSGLGRVHTDAGRYDQAETLLAPVVAAAGKLGDAVEVGRAKLALARALWRHPASRQRARLLATQARDAFAKAGAAARVELTAARTWLGSR